MFTHRKWIVAIVVAALAAMAIGVSGCSRSVIFGNYDTGLSNEVNKSNAMSKTDYYESRARIFPKEVDREVRENATSISIPLR
jgi:hypothetical protein